jgi:hypothetical protein
MDTAVRSGAGLVEISFLASAVVHETGHEAAR